MPDPASLSALSALAQISAAIGIPLLVGAAFARDADERRPQDRRSRFVEGVVLTAVFEAIFVGGLLALR